MKRLLFPGFMVLLIIAGKPANSQQIDPVIAKIKQGFSADSVRAGKPGLFLHLDKSIYVHNENIWFTGYLLASLSVIESYHTLYVALLDPVSQRTVAFQRFIMQMGIGKGYLFLQDTIPVGDYKLVAYTNKYLTDPDEKIFETRISLRGAKPPFTVSLLPFNKKAARDSVNFVCRVTTDYGGLAVGGILNYRLLCGKRVVKKGAVKIDNFGEAKFVVKRSLLTDSAVMLMGNVSRADNRSQFQLPATLPDDPVSIRYFPEGGHLIAGRNTRIAFEILRSQGQRLARKGQLLADGKVLCNVSTNRNGLGAFNVTPVRGPVYEVRLASPDTILQQQFPEIVPDGFSLKVPHGIVDDSLSLVVYAPATGNMRRCSMIIRQQGEIVYWAVLEASPAGSLMNLPATIFKKGLATVSIFDMEGLPLAERTVFIQPEPLQVTITTDSTRYGTRSKVQVSVSVTDNKGEGIVSAFSFATVFRKRVDSLQMKDINRYWYYDQHISDASGSLACLRGDDAVNPDLVLLTRFWTRYSYSSKPPGTAPSRFSDYGQIISEKSRVKKPVELILMSNTMQTLFTDSSGNFVVPENILLTPAETRSFIMVLGEKAQTLKINLLNTYDSVNNRLALESSFSEGWATDLPPAEDVSSFLSDKGPAKILKGVIVSSKKQEDQYYVSPSPCSDYVCIYNILNCKNHMADRGRRPYSGERLVINGVPSIYKGQCQGDKAGIYGGARIKAIYVSKEFYKPDYSKFDLPDPEVNTTVYWSHLIATNKEGKADFSFYTNDVKGSFICLLQGISELGPITGKYLFGVGEK